MSLFKNKRIKILLFCILFSSKSFSLLEAADEVGSDPKGKGRASKEDRKDLSSKPIKFQDFIKNYEDVHKDIISSQKSKITSRSLIEPYGGAPGREYFKTIHEMVIGPALVGFLKEMKKEEPSASKFSELLLGLGAQRRKIAFTVSSGRQDTYYFGSFAITHLQDPITSYKAWIEFLIETSGYNRDLIDIQKGKHGPFLRDEEIADIFAQRLAKELGARVRVHIDNGLFIIESAEAEFGSMEIKFDKYETLGWFNWKRATSMRMCHDNPTVKGSGLTKYFYAALNATSKADLLEALGVLLLRMSHSTVYERGQAASTDWLIKGIAKANGFNLKFSEGWQTPNRSPDIHALCHFDTKLFLKRFKENVELSAISSEEGTFESDGSFHDVNTVTRESIREISRTLLSSGVERRSYVEAVAGDGSCGFHALQIPRGEFIQEVVERFNSQATQYDANFEKLLKAAFDVLGVSSIERWVDVMRSSEAWLDAEHMRLMSYLRNIVIETYTLPIDEEDGLGRLDRFVPLQSSDGIIDDRPHAEVPAQEDQIRRLIFVPSQLGHNPNHFERLVLEDDDEGVLNSEEKEDDEESIGPIFPIRPISYVASMLFYSATQGDWGQKSF